MIRIGLARWAHKGHGKKRNRVEPVWALLFRHIDFVAESTLLLLSSTRLSNNSIYDLVLLYLVRNTPEQGEVPQAGQE